MTFPAGLTLYWFINNLFSIAQQYYVNSLFAKKKEAQKAKKEETQKPQQYYINSLFPKKKEAQKAKKEDQ